MPLINPLGMTFGLGASVRAGSNVLPAWHTFAGDAGFFATARRSGIAPSPEFELERVLPSTADPAHAVVVVVGDRAVTDGNRTFAPIEERLSVDARFDLRDPDRPARDLLFLVLRRADLARAGLRQAVPAPADGPRPAHQRAGSARPPRLQPVLRPAARPAGGRRLPELRRGPEERVRRIRGPGVPLPRCRALSRPGALRGPGPAPRLHALRHLQGLAGAPPRRDLQGRARTG